jgi:hypothetical protein
MGIVAGPDSQKTEENSEENRKTGVETQRMVMHISKMMHNRKMVHI